MKYSKIYLRQLILFITLIMAQSASWAFQNEPDAFRGTEWGTNLDKVDDMVVTEPPNKFGECTYQKKNDKLRIGTGIVESIRYSSLKNRFFFVEIIFSGSNNRKKLLQSYLGLYGQPQESPKTPLGESWIWKGNKVKITFVWLSISNNGFITYEYLPISKERGYL